MDSEKGLLHLAYSRQERNEILSIIEQARGDKLKKGDISKWILIFAREYRRLRGLDTHTKPESKQKQYKTREDYQELIISVKQYLQSKYRCENFNNINQKLIEQSIVFITGRSRTKKQLREGLEIHGFIRKLDMDSKLYKIFDTDLENNLNVTKEVTT